MDHARGNVDEKIFWQKGSGFLRNRIDLSIEKQMAVSETTKHPSVRILTPRHEKGHFLLLLFSSFYRTPL